MQMSNRWSMIVLELLLERADIEDLFTLRFVCRHIYHLSMKRLIGFNQNARIEIASYPFRILKDSCSSNNHRPEHRHYAYRVLDFSGHRLLQSFNLNEEQTVRLTSVNLRSCWSMDEAFLEQLLAGLHAVVSLILDGVYCFNDRHLAVLSNSCRLLRVAHFKQCWRI